MQSCPPRFRRVTPLEIEELRAEGFIDPLPEPAKPGRPKRRKKVVDTEPVFDVRRWRLPSRWRNDKRVGDSAVSKMLRGIDPARYEELSS
jgi:hypothetical protein